MNKELIVVFLENDQKNAYSYREMAEKMSELFQRKISVRGVQEAIRLLMKENPKRVTRHMAKQPWETTTGRTVQQMISYFAIRRQKLVAQSNSQKQENVPIQPQV